VKKTVVTTSFFLAFSLFLLVVGASPTLAQCVPTELGCIPTNPAAFVNWGLKIAIGIAGGVAFLLIVLGAFKILTSSGDPKALQDGKDQITSAIAGLFIIIFSVLILEFLGFRVLQLPGWGIR
jgi:hypothetical protein